MTFEENQEHVEDPCDSCESGMYQANNEAASVPCLQWKVCIQGKYGTVPTDKVNRVCQDCASGMYQSSNTTIG